MQRFTVYHLLIENFPTISLEFLNQLFIDFPLILSIEIILYFFKTCVIPKHCVEVLEFRDKIT